jgi:hypothetical protein
MYISIILFIGTVDFKTHKLPDRFLRFLTRSDQPSPRLIRPGQSSRRLAFEDKIEGVGTSLDEKKERVFIA